ncbi:pantoate--beta-alanine ligase [Parashewanella curva]|uniref:Pantothenate synthetase n=1 Tax=Parashewanella curva TaxID=2338552 RepID=A0A3L8PY49_9GAMM|nr:pantoate--beta-alanine ligase [Parashewanella curva]RLV60230.1 pantoate--beta-alanine ligase [Parashewanella curva]
MKVTAELAELRNQIKAWKAKGETVAFVPTMGNLHQGHLSLVTTALKHADHVVASIYVNPLQFAAHEDLDSYPKTLNADLEALKEVGTALVFTPTTDLIYPKGPENSTKVIVPEDVIGNCGESESRPHFFIGVATVVLKLFNMVQPDVAVFGQKDYQQLAIIKNMVKDLDLPIHIIGVDTYRESNGLAMSSRNNYLTTKQRETAAAIKQTLDWFIKEVQGGVIIDTAIEHAKASLIAEGLTPDYLIVRHADTLQEVTPEDKSLVVLAAAWLGKARLIDNECFQRKRFA